MSPNDELRERLNRQEAHLSPPDLRYENITLNPFELTVGELQNVINSNPKHPIAKSLKATRAYTLPADRKVTMDRVDIEAILDNKQVVVREVVGPDGQISKVKTLVSAAPIEPTDYEP